MTRAPGKYSLGQSAAERIPVRIFELRSDGRTSDRLRLKGAGSQ